MINERVVDHDLAFTRLGDFQNLVALGNAKSHGLFDEDIRARPQATNRDVPVGGWGRCDKDRIGFGLAQKSIEILKKREVGVSLRTAIECRLTGFHHADDFKSPVEYEVSEQIRPPIAITNQPHARK